MKVRYIYSACIEIKTQDVTILTDPWFTDGIYDGSWYHFPKIDDPFTVLSEPDFIYVSHIHPDHYDPTFLNLAIKRWGPKPILIPKFEKNYLELKMKGDGIIATPLTELKIGKTNIHIIPNETGSASDIDSALLVHCGNKTILNLNDCIWKDDHIKVLESLIGRYTKELDLLALGYTGAGAFPQTFYDIDTNKEMLLDKANAKKYSFFERYKRFCNQFPSKVHLPFAGKYLLGGNLSHLNSYRGVADPVEVTTFDDKAVILSDFGSGQIDLNSYLPSSVRDKKYSEEEVNQRILEISKKPLDFESDFVLPFHKINFARLLTSAYKNAHKKSEVNLDYWFIIHINDHTDRKYSFNCNKNNYQFSIVANCDPLPFPRSEIFIDYRYLFGLITTIYHWNNAAVGSMYNTRRFPEDNFNKSAQSFLNFFTV